MIGLVPKEQSDQGLHCFPINLYPLDPLIHCKTKVFFIRAITVFVSSVQVFKIFAVFRKAFQCRNGPIGINVSVL